MFVRITIAFLSFLLLIPSVFAGGSPEDSEYEPVSGLENWEANYDISDLEPDTYNVLIRARDFAGNRSLAGPYNIVVDPASDEPVVSISHPFAGVRVSRNFLIVGVALDDDGVRRVWVQIDDRAPVVADGTQYWSLEVQGDALPDGLHTITAWAEDINGLAGPSYVSQFTLDKTNPAQTLESHANGALFSGNVEVEGLSQDPNGLETIELSRDGGETYERLRFRYDDERAGYRFSFPIRTRDLDDGPHVFWLKSTDSVGSVGVSSFLFFVDNGNPELGFISPGPEEDVFDRIRVSGSATDVVGLSSLAYQMRGAEPQPIPLTPGDPFWSFPLDLRPYGNERVSLRFFLEDLAGNRIERTLDIEVKGDLDTPRLSLFEPQEEALYTGEVFIQGTVSDDDPIEVIEYRLNGQDPVEVEAWNAFSFSLGQLEPGDHRVQVRVMDRDQRWSPWSERRFTVHGAAPEVVITHIERPGVDELGEAIWVAEPYRAGFSLRRGEVIRLRGNASGENPLDRLEVTNNLSIENPLGTQWSGIRLEEAEDGSLSFVYQVPVPELPQRIDLAFRLGDRFGYEGWEQAMVQVLPNLLDSAEPPSDPQLYYEYQDQAVVPRPDFIDLSADSFQLQLQGSFVAQARLDPPLEFAQIRREATRVYVEPVPGIEGSGSAKVVVEDLAGAVFETDVLSFTTDHTEPTLTIDGLDPEQWYGETLPLLIDANDSDPVAVRVKPTMDGPWVSVEPDPETGGWSYGLGENLSPGPQLVTVAAEDSRGNRSQVFLALGWDQELPQMRLITPDQRPINGVVSFSVVAEDLSGIRQLSYTLDSETYLNFGSGPRGMVQVDLTQESVVENLRFRAEDLAGNIQSLDPVLLIDTEADRPRLQIQVPPEGATLTSDFVVSGLTFDDDGIDRIEYSVDGGPWLPTDGTTSFAIAQSIENLEERDYSISVRAFDLAGVMSEEEAVQFTVSKSEPVAKLELPSLETTVTGDVLLVGTAEDLNGIEGVELSLDNGVSFVRARGQEQWEYQLNTRLLTDGVHSIQMRATDGAGIGGLQVTILSIDNTAPTIGLDQPQDGQVYTRYIPLEGRATDNIELERVSYEIRPLVATGEGGDQGIKGDLTSEGIFSDQLDVGDLAPGDYSVVVEAVDVAGNTTILTRKFAIAPPEIRERVSIIYPMEGSNHHGPLQVAGLVEAQEMPRRVLITLNEQIETTVDVGPKGYFQTTIDTSALRPGPVRFSAETDVADGRLISEPVTSFWAEEGPYVQLTSNIIGDYLTDRPYIRGVAGYFRDVGEEEEALPREKQVNLVEISFDNGATFEPVRGREQWEYRVETGEFTNGPFFVLLRVRLNDGSVATSRTLLVIDDIVPEVTLISPEEGGRFNSVVPLLGTAFDESGLQDVALVIRPGDKSSYQVPSFIQGLYIDTQFLGASIWGAGFGLTFFDDVVKLQAQIGQAPAGDRLDGLVIGAKLLSNIATLPFSFLFGPDWAFLSASVAIGANFSVFSMTGEEFAFAEDDSQSKFSASAVVQLEFPKLTFEDWTAFNDISAYTELQLWFIPSEVKSEVVPRLSFGVRLGVF